MHIFASWPFSGCGVQIFANGPNARLDAHPRQMQRASGIPYISGYSRERGPSQGAAHHATVTPDRAARALPREGVTTRSVHGAPGGADRSVPARAVRVPLGFSSKVPWEAGCDEIMGYGERDLTKRTLVSLPSGARIALLMENSIEKSAAHACSETA